MFQISANKYLLLLNNLDLRFIIEPTNSIFRYIYTQNGLPLLKIRPRNEECDDGYDPYDTMITKEARVLGIAAIMLLHKLYQVTKDNAQLR